VIAAASDQWHVMVLFQPSDRHADPGLRHMELTGRRRDAPLLGNLAKHAQIPILQID
jgi:hypothetical protein